VALTETGVAVPKFHSKMAANQELRKFLNLGQTAKENNDVRRLSDAELVAQLAQQAKELGIEIDLSYRLSGEYGVRQTSNQQVSENGETSHHGQHWPAST
jgi:hypothetical protein